MTAMWDKLILILVQTLKIYQVLLDISRSKRVILVEVKPRELEAITKQEEIIIVNAGKIEAAREQIIREIADLYGQSKEVTLSVLIEQADAATAAKLTELSRELDQVMKELASINKLNIELIQQSLNYVNYNINILAQSASETTYTPPGKSNQTGSSRNMFDAKV